jgi:hypothetical protein
VATGEAGAAGAAGAGGLVSSTTMGPAGAAGTPGCCGETQVGNAPNAKMATAAACPAIARGKLRVVMRVLLRYGVLACYWQMNFRSSTAMS